MIRVKTLTVQLIDAQPDRIRICRIDGESLVTVVVPREDLAEAKSLPNIPQRGVYYLLDEDHGNVNRVYAGQTTQGIAGSMRTRPRRSSGTRPSCSSMTTRISAGTLWTSLKQKLSTTYAPTARTRPTTM